MRKAARIDKTLAILLAVLVLGGAMVFVSAAFGILGRGETHVSSVVFNHLVLGLGLGLVALCIGLLLDYRTWRTFAVNLYVLSLALTALVFVPYLGFEHGGGKRWLDVFGFSFQPAEILKVGAIIMAAAYFAGIKSKATTLTYGLGGFLAILALPGIILILQPDLGTLGVIGISVLAVYVASGASWRHVALVVVIALLALSALAVTRPYVMERIMTFINPAV